jgi:hypothetical protein
MTKKQPVPFETRLTNKGRMLVSKVTRYRNTGQNFIYHISVNLAAALNGGKHICRNAISGQHIFIPLQCMQIHKLGTACIGYVGDMNTAVYTAGQVPDQECIHVAENRLAFFSIFAYAVYVIQKPFQFKAAEIG